MIDNSRTISGIKNIGLCMVSCSLTTQKLVGFTTGLPMRRTVSLQVLFCCFFVFVICICGLRAGFDTVPSAQSSRASPFDVPTGVWEGVGDNPARSVEVIVLHVFEMECELFMFVLLF